MKTRAKRMPSGLWFIAALSIFPSSCFGEIYKWVDSDGKVHFADHMPVPAQVEGGDLGWVPTVETVFVEDRGPASSMAGDTRVVIYTTPKCGFCTKAKRFFRNNAIPFIEKDISENKRARQEFAELEGVGVPLILVGSKRMSGFDPDGFLALYQQ